jgi:hypothetical protein
MVSPFDICECGDYRCQHKDGVGPCDLNKYPNNGGISHGNKACLSFRLERPTAQPDWQMTSAADLNALALEAALMEYNRYLYGTSVDSLEAMRCAITAYLSALTAAKPTGEEKIRAVKERAEKKLAEWARAKAGGIFYLWSFGLEDAELISDLLELVALAQKEAGE